MLTIDIPNGKKIEIKNLVLDFNGTLAINGDLITGVAEKLNKLADSISIHIITADTFDKVAENMEGIRCKIVILSGFNQQKLKLNYIQKLGAANSVAIGNGLNDKMMLNSAGLSISVIQAEGASIKTVINSDIVCTSIIDALDILLNPLRVVATLRN